MSTKFPSSAVLMELAVYMKRRRIRTIVEWAPREFNRESDNLANGITEGFNPALEIKIRPEEITWEILPEALEGGREAEWAYGAAKERGKLPNRVDVTRRRSLELRIRGVWSCWRRKNNVWPRVVGCLICVSFLGCVSARNDRVFTWSELSVLGIWDGIHYS